MTRDLRRGWPYGLLALCVLYVVSGLRLPPLGKPFDLTAFGEIPVLNGGRLKPLDTVARTSLLLLRGKQTVRAGEQSLPAVRWLADMLFQADQANTYRVFEIDDPDVLGLMGIQQTSARDYAFQDLASHLQTVQDQASQAEALKPEQRSRFQNAVLALQSKLVLYQKLQNTVQIPGAQDVAQEVRHFAQELAPALAHHFQTSAKDPRLKALGLALERYRFMNDVAEFYPLPGARGLKKMDWVSVGQGVLDSMTAPAPHPGVAAFAQMGDAYRASDAADFNAAVAGYRSWLASTVPEAEAHGGYESVFNAAEPFYRAMVLYVLVFVFIAVSWLWRREDLRRTAFLLLILAFIVHTVGLAARMWLQGRPPVTNLYSSAIFVGWAAVLLGMALEKLYRNGIGCATASAIGFVTLIIAHHLMNQGDTLEMMRAVLDSNFWLATHVVCITIGYSSTFLSGFLAILYLARRVFERGWNDASAANLERMVYGIVCFSAFFSFLGTILGGIWADQSWGRFWGWDPKENGALMIVLWNVFILHARLGGFAKPRAIMMMAVFGNIVTACSWFGVNMLGIGLHSYGFMDKAFAWLVVFAVTQVVIILLGIVPDYATRRFAPRESRRPKAEG